MVKTGLVSAALLLLLGVVVPDAHAQEPAAEPTASLQALLQEALAANPEIARARELWRAEQSRVPYVGALEDPVLGVGFDDQPFDRGLLGKREVSLRQAFPFPGKRSVMTEMATWDAKAAREMALETIREVLTEVKLAYFGLFMLESQLSTLRESNDALRDVVQVTQTRYETGVAGQQDLLLAQVERTALGGDVRRLEAQVRAARAKLNLLLARAPGTPLGRVSVTDLSPFVATREELLAGAHGNRPLLRATEHEVEAARAAERLARIAYRPDFMVSAGYMTTPGMDDEWRAEIGLTLPVWKGRKQDAAAGEAARRRAASEQMLENERNRVSMTVEEQFAELTSDRQIVGLYRDEILPLAELAYSSARASYRTGQVTFILLLESLRKWIELKRMYYEVLADAEMRLASLEAAVGSDLGGIHLDLEAALSTSPQAAGGSRSDSHAMEEKKQ
jgi:cobalt-zinc-cadmium efflux system outer membrane protein